LVSRRIEPVSYFMTGPLALLHSACFPEEPWGPHAIADIIGMTGFFGRVAWESEMPGGFALALDLRGECEIVSLGVLPERRRERVGMALLDSVCAEAGRRGAESIVLEVAVDNVAALALYAVRGFIPVGRRGNYYRRMGHSADALVLRLAIAASSTLS
jgi:ribosomal-protein-alanine N-acetyltransferase